MTLQRAAQSRSGIPEADLRRPCRREGLHELGLCVCGLPILWHLDADGWCLPCDHGEVIAWSGHTASDAFTEDETRLAWLIVAKVEH